MSDLGDLSRLLDRFGLEYEIKGVWVDKVYTKMLDLPDPGPTHEGRVYGVEFLFDPINLDFRSMTMYYQPHQP